MTCLLEVGPKILPVVPQLIIPMKVAFNTKDPAIICTVSQGLADVGPQR